MALNVSCSISIQGIGNGVQAVMPISGSGATDISETISDNSTDAHVTFNLDVTATKLVYLHSDQVLTIKTNSDTAPQETITLAEKVPLLYINSIDGFEMPFLGDVTGLYVTNESGAAATLTIKTLSDVTV